MAEPISKAIKELQKTNLSQYSTTSSIKKIDKNGELSIYQGERTKEGVALQVVKIKAAFPQLEAGFYKLLIDSFKRNNWPDKRIEDAVNHVIDTQEFPKPLIGRFINFDQKIKIYTHDEMEDKQLSFETYQSVNLGGKRPVWCHVQDIEKYNLEKWNK